MSDLVLDRIERFECPICGIKLNKEIEVRFVNDKNKSKNKIWVCKKHKIERRGKNG